MTPRSKLLIAMALAVMFVATTRARATCFVDARATGAKDGSSWIDAYNDLQAALTESSCAEIWVAKGIYTPSNIDRRSSFAISPGVAVYGGFAGGEIARDPRDFALNRTVLSGDIDRDDAGSDGVDATAADIRSDNSFHVIVMDGSSGAPILATTVLDGFTITGGNANDTTFDFDAKGAGLFCRGEGFGHECSPTLGNLVFSGNNAYEGGTLFDDGTGGGVSSPHLTNIVFAGNAGQYGAAMLNDADTNGTSNPLLDHVAFLSNTAKECGAMLNNGTNGGYSTPALTRVTFISNTTTAYGGGAMCNYASFAGMSSPTLSDVTFRGNSAYGNGGAIRNVGEAALSNPVLADVLFEGNSADYGGAMSSVATFTGVSSPVLNRVAFVGNSAHFGGAMDVDGGDTNSESSPILTNVTFSRNRATLQGGAFNDAAGLGTSNPTFTNVTFFGNSAESGGAISFFNDEGKGKSVPSLHNVILWGDSATDAGPEIDVENVTPTIDHSIVQGGCPAAWHCTNLTTTDPKLGELANHGGETPTTMPAEDSVAIDAGDAVACPAEDQRNVARPQGTGCDIGAVERLQPEDVIFRDGLGFLDER